MDVGFTIISSGLNKNNWIGNNDVSCVKYFRQNYFYNRRLMFRFNVFILYYIDRK